MTNTDGKIFWTILPALGNFNISLKHYDPSKQAKKTNPILKKNLYKSRQPILWVHFAYFPKVSISLTTRLRHF